MRCSLDARARVRRARRACAYVGVSMLFATTAITDMLKGRAELSRAPCRAAAGWDREGPWDFLCLLILCYLFVLCYCVTIVFLGISFADSEGSSWSGWSAMEHQGVIRGTG